MATSTSISTSTLTPPAATADAADATLATLATDEVLCATQPIATPLGSKYKIELDVCNEYDAVHSRTFIFTLPRTRRARRARHAVAKIATKGFTDGNCDRIIRILKPFPCRERVTDDKRMFIRMLSSEIDEDPCHVPVAHDDVLDAEVSDWEYESSDDEVCA